MITNQTLDNMLRTGGSFAQKIAWAYYAADHSNREKLEAAFPELFARYGKSATTEKGK